MNIRRLSYWMAQWGLVIFLIAQPLISTVNAQDGHDEATSLRLEPVLRFSHLNSDDGLIQNSVEAILQDSSGFMWFGTEGGLSRYDGYRFTTFEHDPDNPNSLTHNHIRDLYEDRDGMIWIATEGGGINRLDPNTLEFTSYAPSFGARDTWNGIVGDRHFNVFQDSRGHIWAGGTRPFGLSDFDLSTETAVIYYPAENDSDGYIGNGSHEIIETAEQQLWVAADFSIARFDLNTQQFTNYDLRQSGERRVTTLLQTSSGDIWAGGTNGLYKFNQETDNFDHFTEPRGVNDILEDEYGILWLAAQNGLYHFDPQTGQIIGHEEPHAGESDSLNSSTLRELYQDRYGMIWIAGTSGLDIYDPHLTRFDYYRHTIPSAPSSFAEGQIQSIHIAGETMWVGVDSALHKVDLTTNAVIVYKLEDYKLGTQQITSILQDHTGLLWLGGSQGRVLQFDSTAETFNEYATFGVRGAARQEGAPPRQSSVVALHEDAQHNLWIILSQGGIYRLDEARETSTQFDAPSAALPLEGNAPSNVPIQPPISGLSVDRAGNLWLTNLNSFYRFDPITGTHQRMPLRTSQGSDTWTEASLEDEQGIIWVASRDGLFRLDPETGAVTNYTTKDGLPTNFLVGILQDESGDLWISTKKGLSQFTPVTETFRNYDVFDGLQGNEFSNRIFAKASDGRMFFGGPNGLTAFYPEAIVNNTYQPLVVLDDFELFNESVQPGVGSPLSQPIWLTDRMTLNHDQNILSFEFAVLNYVFDDVNQYRYRLDGLETQWNQTDSTRRFATYTNLRAGDYTFRVQAANRDGVWSEHEVALALTVLPPWWETGWFQLTLGVSVMMMLLGGYQWRIRTIARRNRALQEEVDKQTAALQVRTRELQTSESQLRLAKDAAEAASRAKSAFLANMSHELRSPLNAILGFTQVISRNRSLPGEVHDNLGVILHSGEHLLALINQVLDLSKIEAGRMTLDESTFDLHRLLSEVEDMFILAADDKRLKLVVACSDNVPRYLVADVTKLRQTLINLISNALKFTLQGGVTVRVRQVNGSSAHNDSPLRLEFEVEDTGPGIQAEELAILFDAFAQTSTGRKAQEGTGLGLTISRNFVRLMGGDIHVTSEPGKGTTFRFDIACRAAAGVTLQTEHFHRQVVGLVPDQPQYRILVVDDKWANRQLIVQWLEPLGFEILEAENGKEAVEFAHTFQPHLIWMDIRMRVMDGMEATRQLKVLPIGRTTKIIALTASVYEEERADFIKAGFDDFIRKPIQAHVLFEILHKHIGVQYVYADVSPVHTAAKEMMPLDEVKAALSRIPAELLIQLSEDTELGDMAKIDKTIAKIRDHHARVGEALYRMAQRFQFDQLLELLKEEAHR